MSIFKLTAASEASRLSTLLFVVTALWGLNMTAIKTIAFSYEPEVMATERAAVAAAFMAALFWWRGGAQRKLRPGRRHLITGFACAALMVYANQMLLSAGMKRTTATNSSVAIALSPLVSALMAAIILREPMSLRRIAGIALGLGGVLLVVLRSSGAQLGDAGVGDAMVVASVVTFSTGSVLIQQLARETGALYASMAIYVWGTAMLLAHTLALGTAPQLLSAWAPGVWPVMLVLFSSLISTALGGLAWNHAIIKMGVARVSLWFYWVPVFGVGFAALLLGESLSIWHGVGLVAVIAGTWLGTHRRA